MHIIGGRAVRLCISTVTRGIYSRWMVRWILISIAVLSSPLKIRECKWGEKLDGMQCFGYDFKVSDSSRAVYYGIDDGNTIHGQNLFGMVIEKICIKHGFYSGILYAQKKYD